MTIKINDKLSLKMPTMEDSKEIYEVVDKDRDHLRKWLTWVDKTTSVKSIQDNISERIEKFDKKEAASFYARYEDKWIASVGFISVDDVNKRGEIGYWLSSEFEGRGLMTECVKASMEYHKAGWLAQRAIQSNRSKKWVSVQRHPDLVGVAFSCI